MCKDGNKYDRNKKSFWDVKIHFRGGENINDFNKIKKSERTHQKRKKNCINSIRKRIDSSGKVL